MKIAVTGSTGFVGAALVRHFATAGHEVLAYGRLPQPPSPLLRYARYVCADLTRPLSPLQADACIHVAALASDTAAAKDLYLANVVGTRHVLRAAEGCSHFVQISSSSVYRPSPLPHREEDTPDSPESLSPYGYSKLLAEQVLFENPLPHQRRLILRPRGIYGVGDRVLLPRLLGLVRMGFILSPGELRVQTSLTHVSNLGNAIEEMLKQPKGEGMDIYNLADNEPYLLRHVVKAVAERLTQRQMSLLSLPVGVTLSLSSVLSLFRIKSKLTPLAVYNLTRPNVLDLSRAKEEIGYHPLLSLEEGLDEMAEWICRTGGWPQYLRNAEIAPWAGL